MKDHCHWIYLTGTAPQCTPAAPPTAHLPCSTLTGVQNVKVVWARAEEAGQDLELREQHHLALARAVGETRVLAELCLPFVRVGGLWVAAKGPNPHVSAGACA